MTDENKITISDFYTEEEKNAIFLRAVIRVGVSRCVTLPYKWVRENKIDKKVFIEVKGDKLIITPFTSSVQ